MGDKLKAGAEEVKTGAGEATARARETMHDAQVSRELQNAYTELGRTTYTLVDEGSLKDERLDHAVAQFASWDRSWSTLSRRRDKSRGGGRAASATASSARRRAAASGWAAWQRGIRSRLVRRYVGTRDVRSGADR